MTTYRCPGCSSTNTEKDRDPFRGGDTGDRKCNACGYIGWYASFEVPEKYKHKEKPK